MTKPQPQYNKNTMKLKNETITKELKRMHYKFVLSLLIGLVAMLLLSAKSTHQVLRNKRDLDSINNIISI